MNTRVYPLRTSSNLWKIKLYSKHICNEECKVAYIEDPISDDLSILFIVDNPQYDKELETCNYHNILNQSSIRLDYFDKNNPKTIDGDLLYTDQIVIPDKKISVNITFPLRESKKILIETNDPLGFSLKEIIFRIQQIYRWIYKREEETCTENDYIIINQCKCLEINRKEFILKGKDKKDKNDKKDEKEEDICPICLDEIDEKEGVYTECDHLFHIKCLSNWIDQKETCPTCRTNLYKCDYNSTYCTYTNYRCKVIPKEYRGVITQRNETDGIFKIYGYDKEDLILKSMIYNNLTKTLSLEIIG